MAAVVASPLRPRLTVLEGGRDELAHRGQLENAWIEVQAVASEAERFAGTTLEAARRIQVAIAADRPASAGQLAHELELAAPLHGYRARRSATEARQALEDLDPKKPVPA